jgi:hypothetical protein
MSAGDAARLLTLAALWGASGDAEPPAGAPAGVRSGRAGQLRPALVELGEGALQPVVLAAGLGAGGRVGEGRRVAQPSPHLGELGLDRRDVVLEAAHLGCPGTAPRPLAPLTIRALTRPLAGGLPPAASPLETAP